MPDTVAIQVGSYDLEQPLIPVLPHYDAESATASLLVAPNGHLYVLSRFYQEEGEDGEGHESIAVYLDEVHPRRAGHLKADWVGYMVGETNVDENEFATYEELDEHADQMWAQFHDKAMEAS